MIYNFYDLTFRFLEVSEFCHEDGVVDVEARAYGAISYKMCGESSFEFSDGTSLRANGGDIIYIPAGVSYRAEYSGSKSIVIHVLDASYSEKELIHLKNSARAELAFLNLKKEWAKEHSHNLAKARVYEILELLKNDAEENVHNGSFHRYQRFFDENFTRVDFSVEKAAMELHLSPSGMRRAFVSSLGTSPVQYLTELRMNRAVELLINSTLSIKEIAAECGYEDEKYFSRVFKKKYGYPPSAFSAK
jgi:two-component system response regulator YesN